MPPRVSVVCAGRQEGGVRVGWGGSADRGQMRGKGQEAVTSRHCDVQPGSAALAVLQAAVVPCAPVVVECQKEVPCRQ